jgi:hypothetical protein
VNPDSKPRLQAPPKLKLGIAKNIREIP